MQMKNSLCLSFVAWNVFDRSLGFVSARTLDVRLVFGRRMLSFASWVVRIVEFALGTGRCVLGG